MKKSGCVDIGLVGLLFALALAARVALLPTTPPGLFNDEAANGIDALSILNGSRPVFLELNHGREPLFIYLQALAVALLSATPLALRLTAAVIGALTVPALYWMVREAFGENTARSRRVAFWTAAFVAFSYWHLNFSRLGFRVITLPLFAAITSAFFFRAWYRLDREKPLPWRDLLLCGATLGLSLYTYTAARFLPVLIVLLVLVGLLGPRRDRMGLPRAVQALTVIALVALVVFAPLGAYFLAHPDAFFQRAGDVLITSHGDAAGPGGTLQNAAKVALMFATAGDPNLRHNPAGRPLFDPLLAAWLAAGVILAVIRWRSLPYAFALLSLLIFLLPAVLTGEGSPHSLRGFGAVTGAYLLVVLAMVEAGERLGTLLGRRSKTVARAVVALLPLPFLLVSAFTGLNDYFKAFPGNEQLAAAFEADGVKAGQLMAAQSQQGAVWLLPIPHLLVDLNGFGPQYAFRGSERRAVVPAAEWHAPRVLDEATKGQQFAYLVHWRAGKVMPQFWFVDSDPKHVVDFLLNKYGRKLEDRDEGALPFTVYELPEQPDYRVATAYTPRDVTFGGKVQLEEMAYGRTASDRLQTPETLEEKRVVSGAPAWAALRWRALTPLESELKITLRLLDESGHLAGQTDDLLVGDDYPFKSPWDAGQRAHSYHIMPTLPALHPGRYRLVVSVYDAKTGTPLAASTPDGETSIFYELGGLDVTPSDADTPVSPSSPLPEPIALAPDLSLLGYDLPRASVSPGGRLPLTLYWRSPARPARDYDALLELVTVDGQTRVAQRASQVGGPYPATRWREGEVVRDWPDFEVPPAAGSGTYRLRVSLANGDGTAGPIDLGPVEVSGRERIFTQPAVPHTMEARLGPSIVLLGYDLGTGEVAAGGPLRLRLYWKAESDVADDYTVFAHLLGADGKIYGQRDQAPGGGRAATSGWVMGEYIIDEYEIPIEVGTPPGSYELEVGMYDPATFVRLPVTGAAPGAQGDRVVLDEKVTVTQQPAP